MPKPRSRSRNEADLEAFRKQAFANRRFDPDSYAEELTPELPGVLQVAIAAGELAEIDYPSEPTSQAQEELARQKAESDRMAAEFCFLDPADYADEEARRGRVLTPAELLAKVARATRKQCWYSLASEAMVRKELSPRDVALAKLKIGENVENLRDPARWFAAIQEVRQEERNLVPLRPYKLFALQICRTPDHPEYCCWVPGCHLREYDLVRFDSHNVPEQQIRGWRTALIEIIRKRFASEQDVTAEFGEATGVVSKRYNLVLHGLRNRPELSGDQVIGSSGDLKSQNPEPSAISHQPSQEEPAAAPCLECHHGSVHFPFCSQYEAWYNGLTDNWQPGNGN